MTIEAIGALCFGLVVGWVTYRTLRRTNETVSLSNIASVVGAVGGAAVTGLFKSQLLFSWYCIGLFMGFFLYLILGHTLFKDSPWLEHQVEGPVRRTLRLARRSLGRVFRAALSGAAPTRGAREEAAPAPMDEAPWSPTEEASYEPASGEPAPPQRERPPRYANAALFDRERDRVLDPRTPIEPRQVVRLRLDIGELSAESQVEGARALPAVPEDVWLDVMVSSTDFGVSAGPDEEPSEVSHGRLFLPGDGSPARTEDCETFLWFWLRAPRARERPARARIGYYYRNALLQSQLLEASIGGALPEAEGRCFRLRTDYAASESFTGLGAIPQRPRISVLTNDDGLGTHQLLIRAADDRGSLVGEPAPLEIDEQTLGSMVRDLRTALRSVAPTSKQRRRAQLIQDLKKLAPLGADLYASTVLRSGAIIDAAWSDPDRLVIQVSRPRTSGFTLPWGFLYEIPLYSGAQLEVCPIVEEWDGKTPLVTGEARRCPAAEGAQHRENTLCPFGFWGYRYSIEQLASAAEPWLAIEVPAAPQVVAGVTHYNVKPADVTAHLERLVNRLQESFYGATVQPGDNVATIRRLLAGPLPLVYFFCHGERPRPGDPDTYLGVGDRESITAKDFLRWVEDWRRYDGKVVWGKGKGDLRPLVFINACHSAEINPDTLVSYLDAFVGGANAAGLIGTEVKVNQELAMEVAESFLGHLARPGGTVDGALHKVRLDFLAAGNLFGLAYTPYCWADLKLVRAS